MLIPKLNFGGNLYMKRLSKMKKFILIKWYPSLSKDIEEGMIATLNNSKSYSLNVNGGRRFVSRTEVENHPEFWGELCPNCGKVIKSGESIKRINTDCVCDARNYEILSLKFDGRILTVGKEIVSEKAIEDWLLENSSIHSVKRLSDGEVFTVGDKTTTP